MTVLKFGTWAPDISNLNSDTSQLAQNVLPRLDGYGPVKAPGNYSLPLVYGNDSVTKSLLHFDTTTPIDVASGVTTVATWASVGTVAVNSSVYKFGGFSYLFGGGTVEATSTEAAKLAIGSNNFAMEGWLAPATSTVSYNVGGWGNSAIGATSTAFRLSRTSGGKISFALYDGTASTTITGSTNVINSTTFDHWVFAKKDSYLYLAINGVLDAAPVSVSSSYTVPTVPYRWKWGAAGENSTNTYSGRADEVRLSVGDARFPFASTQTAGTTVFNVPPAAYGPLPNGINRGFFYARTTTDGTIALFAGTLNRLWKMDNSTLGWVDVSKSLSAGYTDLPSSYHWQFVQYGSLVIATQPNTVPQSFTLGSSTQFANLSADANLPQAAYCAVVGRYVVLTGLTSTPFRAQWSDTPAGATGWTAGGSAVTGSQDFPSGGITRGIAGGEFGVLFQDTNIRRMILTNSSTSPFQFDLLAQDLGLLAPYSVVRAGADVFFLSNKGFHQISPIGLPIPIGIGRFDQTFFRDYDNAQLQLIIGAVDPESQRVLWAYKSGAGTSGLFDKIIVYDTVLKRGSVITGLSGEYLGTLAAPGLTLDNLSISFPNLDAMSFSLDNVAIAALPKAALFDSTHILSLFTGENKEATIDTPEIALDPQRRVRVRGTRPSTDASSCYISIGGREHEQQAVTYNAEQAVNSVTGKAPQNVSTRLARGRMRIVAGTTWTYATGIEPDFVPGGKR